MVTEEALYTTCSDMSANLYVVVDTKVLFIYMDQYLCCDLNIP